MSSLALVDGVYRFRVARGGRVVDGVYRFRVAGGGRVVGEEGGGEVELENST